MASPFIGEIRLVPYNFAPQGWSFCDGTIIPITQNETLYTLIGTTYGGDGAQTFALPDLRGRVPIHMSANNSFLIGQRGGVETVTLSLGQIPAHSHVPQCNSASANQTSPSGNFWGNWSDAQFSDQPPVAAMNGAAVAVAGGSQSHDNMIPFQVLNFIISLFGIFPSRN